jgi:integrase
MSIKTPLAIERFDGWGISWHGWHGFRRGLASNLNRLGVDDSVIQRILRHSTVATTQNHCIKTASPDAIAAMKQFSEALLCSTCAPDGSLRVKSAMQREYLSGLLV